MTTSGFDGANLLRGLKPGDVLVVWKLDRLSRSLSDLLQIFKRLDEVSAGFRSLTEAIDTTTAAGRMMLQMLGAFAEFERQMIRERTKLGLAEPVYEGRINDRRGSISERGCRTRVERKAGPASQTNNY